MRFAEFLNAAAAPLASVILIGTGSVGVLYGVDHAGWLVFAGMLIVPSWVYRRATPSSKE